jgi:hypothetical protein
MIITLVVVICLDVINDPVLLDLPSLVVVAFGICAAEFELPVEPLLEITAMGDKECIHRVEKEGDLGFFFFFFSFLFFFSSSSYSLFPSSEIAVNTRRVKERTWEAARGRCMARGLDYK